MDKKQLAKMIDHTLLKPDASIEQIAKLCDEAKKYQFATVCVNPTHIERCASALKGSPVGVCTVIGFPLGANTSEAKAFEASNAIKLGASEVDMVINIGAVKSKNFDLVKNDIQTVFNACGKTPLKVIIETSLLSQEEKVKVCQIAKEVGVAFVKTSTGFSGGGATAEDITLMRQTVGPAMGVKASGGVRDLASALKMIECGATRLGTSSGVALMEGLESQNSY